MEVLSLERKTGGKSNVTISIGADELTLLTNAVYHYQKTSEDAAETFEALRRLQILLVHGRIVMPKSAKEEKQ